jgi:hypothetical protein
MIRETEIEARSSIGCSICSKVAEVWQKIKDQSRELTRSIDLLNP